MNSQQNGLKARTHRAKSRSRKAKASSLKPEWAQPSMTSLAGTSPTDAPIAKPALLQIPPSPLQETSKRVNTSYHQFPPHQQHNTTQHNHHGGTTLPQGRAPISRRFHLPLRQHSRPLPSKTRPKPTSLRKQRHHAGPNARARARISRRGKTHISPKQQNLVSNSKSKGLG